MKHLQTLQTDAAGFSEINVDTSKVAITRKLHKALRANLKCCTLQCASSSIKAEHNYKPGGTMSLVRDNLTAEFNPKESIPWDNGPIPPSTAKEHANSQ
jgi:hypothetical protein